MPHHDTFHFHGRKIDRVMTLFFDIQVSPSCDLQVKGLPDQNTVSWNTLIIGYTKHNQVHEALVPSSRCKMRAFPHTLSPLYAS